uniref:Uncharacterized protein n=2 Tax=Meloidogyne TaxID=189290 RepID=A0A6V7VWI8_MELEN|nr:unnamed protein product [Meloidogyne enterolobii]
MYRDLLAGYIAGSSGTLIGYPLDILKTRVQLNKNLSVGFTKIAKEILQKEGIFAFYKGMAAPFISAGLINSLLFSGYTLTLKELQNNKKSEKDFKTIEVNFLKIIY